MKVTTVETTKVTHGLRINIVDYCVFQDPASYEGNNEGNDERITKELRRKRQGNNKNKNDKNDKNDKNNINIMSMDLVHEVQTPAHKKCTAKILKIQFFNKPINKGRAPHNHSQLGCLSVRHGRRQQSNQQRGNKGATKG